MTYSVIIQKLVKAKSESIMNTINALEIDNFVKAISLINNANRVQIVGMGSSSLAGKDLGYKLNISESLFYIIAPVILAKNLNRN